MTDPICIQAGMAGKHWPEVGWMILAHWLASRLDPFGQNLTQSARTKSDLGWFCTMIWDICGRVQLSLKVGNWQWAGCVLPEIGLDDSCILACLKTRCVWPNPDQAIQIRSGSVLHNMIHVFFEKTELNWMWGVGSGIYNPA